VVGNANFFKKSLIKNANLLRKGLTANFFKKSLIKNANLLRKGLIENGLATA
jgi:hypothetical protein